MILPDNSVGPTDVQTYRDCPRRFEFGLRRHTEAGEAPEAQGATTAYGSAIHEAIAWVEQNDATEEEAVQRAFDVYSKWLDPEDLMRLRTDLATYREREYVGVRTVAVEREVRMPLFEFEGQTIFLRGRLDRLLQRLDNPGVFVHVDYKSSRWEKTEQDVHNDRQLWTYNLLIHYVWPECERLVQVYDQLSYGPLTTSKTDEQREQIRDWLIHQITAILRDQDAKPAFNEWCPWCPIMESCPVVTDLSDYATATIAALAPAEKQGRKTVLQLDPAMFEVYVEQMGKTATARRVLDRFERSVKDVIRDMPSSRREELGYRLSQRHADVFTPDGLRAAHEILGDEFYGLVGLTKTAVERIGDERAADVLSLMERREKDPMLVPTKR